MKFVSHFVLLDEAPSRFERRHEMRDVWQVVDSEKTGISAFHVARHISHRITAKRFSAMALIRYWLADTAQWRSAGPGGDASWRPKQVTQCWMIGHFRR
jgi:hypothetical protein